MATVIDEPPVTVKTPTLQDLVDGLGGIPLSRILARPAPGTATLHDLIATKNCELVDGVLVEKAMGYRESLLAGALIGLLRDFVMPRNLGLVTGEGGTVRLTPGLVRQTQTIQGGLPLTGFRLVLADLFGELDQMEEKLKNG